MNNEKENDSVATPAADYIKFMILQNRQKVMESLSEYYKYKLAGAAPPLYNLQARANVLYSEISAALARWAPKPKEDRLSSEEIYKKINSDTFEDIRIGIDEINYWLDEKKITRIDNRKNFDRTSAEQENMENED